MSPRKFVYIYYVTSHGKSIQIFWNSLYETADEKKSYNLYALVTSLRVTGGRTRATEVLLIMIIFTPR